MTKPKVRSKLWTLLFAFHLNLAIYTWTTISIVSEIHSIQKLSSSQNENLILNYFKRCGHFFCFCGIFLAFDKCRNCSHESVKCNQIQCNNSNLHTICDIEEKVNERQKGSINYLKMYAQAHVSVYFYDAQISNIKWNTRSEITKKKRKPNATKAKKAS